MDSNINDLTVVILSGIFFGGTIRRFGSRPVCITGAFVTAIGYLLSAWATSVVHLYLTYGIISGN